MTGLSLDRAADHFVLRNERPDGTKATMSLTPIEILTLAEMAPTMRQQALAMMYPSQNKSSVEAIMAMDVFDFQLRPEVREAKLLLMLRLGKTGSSAVAYALLRSLADRLARAIAALVPSMRESPPTQQ
jgi:hypothetical protein